MIDDARQLVAFQKWRQGDNLREILDPGFFNHLEKAFRIEMGSKRDQGFNLIFFLGGFSDNFLNLRRLQQFHHFRNLFEIDIFALVDDFIDDGRFFFRAQQFLDVHAQNL